MSSWLARSLANSLHIDQNDDEDNKDDDDHHHPHQNDAVLQEEDSEDRFDNIELNNNHNHKNQSHNHDDDDGDDGDGDGDGDDNQGRGVKEDLSEFTETLTRQLWGVASFLAPPPPPPPPPPPRRLELERKLEEEELDRSGSENEYGDEEYMEGSENYSDEEEDDAVGVTDEALAFAQNIAHHPETWLDFPLADEEESEDFEISDAQLKHALAIERLSPRLAALRIELCPAHMTEGYFWMVYFVLLHSRLNKHDADLLSTPQLVQARAMWMQELQKQTKQETEDWFGRKTSFSQGSTHSPRTYSPRQDSDRDPSEDSYPKYTFHPTYTAEPRSYHTSTDFDTEKHPIECNGVQTMNKSVEDPFGESEKELLPGSSKEVLLHNYDDDDEEDDDWLEDTADLEGYTASGAMVGHEEDVSFSDLEEDSNWTMAVKPK